MERIHSFIGMSLIILLASFPPYGHATRSNWGISANTILYGKEPEHFKGYQFLIDYYPPDFYWLDHQLELYLDLGFSHFWTNETSYHRIVNIYAFAPVFRYHLPGLHLMVHPYVELSIGIAYLNQTYFENRRLGIHFAFQDRVGLGVQFGPDEAYSIGLHAVHYSNARLAHSNSGITALAVLDIGYRFL